MLKRGSAGKVESPFWTLEQAAKYLGVCPNTVARAVKLGELRPGKVGRIYRFSKEQIDRDMRSGR